MVLLCLIEVNVPTAYMVVPHCTSCRTCSVVPVAFSCGVGAGVLDTGPAVPAARADVAPTMHTAAAAAITPARRVSHHLRPCMTHPLPARLIPDYRETHPDLATRPRPDAWLRSAIAMN